ncbi:MAG: hypothetical protein ABI140_05520 [Jatrophihabitantaceae bacterium]
MIELRLPALRPQRLTSGGRRWVLVADFQPFAAGRRLAELLAAGAASAELSILQLDPAQDLIGADYLALPELAAGYADALQAELSADQPAEVLVVGYCSAAVLAAGIADRLVANKVSMLLLRPTWPDESLIAAVLAEIRTELGATDPAPALTGTPIQRLDAVLAQLHADLRGFALAHQLDPDSRPLLELLDRYRGWFGYLVSACDALDLGWQPDRSLPLQIFSDVALPAALPWPAPAGFRQLGFQLPEAEADATEQLALAVGEHLGRAH